MLGIGVMIRDLGGNEESARAAQAALGKVISGVSIGNSMLHLSFTDGTGIRIQDEGQSCCERRWMHTDDTLSDFIGATLVGLELRDAPNIVDEESDVHEVQFLAVRTDRGTLTISNHNDHNGYYGGFALRVAAE